MKITDIEALKGQESKHQTKGGPNCGRLTLPTKTNIELGNLALTRRFTGGSKQTRTADPLLVRQVL
jgi:hypothetical protein